MIDELIKKIGGSKKKIILTETDDRILKAANFLLEKNLVDIIFIGEKKDTYDHLEEAEWINPNSIDVSYYIDRLCDIRKDKQLSRIDAEKLLLDNYMYLACILLLDKKADGVVSGINHSTSDTLRPALQIIKSKNKKASSFFIMETSKKELGSNGIFIFADCGLIQSPDSLELKEIGIQSIDSFETLIEDKPKVAYLSHSTYSSSNHQMVDKVRKAVELISQEKPNYIIDGPIQLDAAIIKDVATLKCSDSPLKGEANILIFPDIDSGNIGYKLVERFADAKAYGPLTQGLNYPVNDLSRGSSVEDVIGVILITALQASKNML